MELVIYQPQEGAPIQAIEFNHIQLKQELALALEKYQGLVYTDDTIKDAKSDRAKLNTFKSMLEDKRKEVKKQCMEPYEAFEKKIKEITAMIDAPVLAIDGQVKAYEDKQKSDKQETIAQIYGELIGELTSLLPLAKIMNPRWLNATFKLPAIREEMTAIIANVKTGLAAIEDIKSEFKMQIQERFLATLDLASALTENRRLEEQKARLEEYAQAQQQTIVQTPTQPVQPIQEAQQPDPIQPELIVMDFRVWVTGEQLQALKAFLQANNIKYGRAI